MSDLSRRSVMAAGATGLVAGGVLAEGGQAGAATSAAVAARPSSRPFTTSAPLYARSRFADLHRARFSVRGPGVSTSMVLIAIDDLVGAPHGDQRRYQLTFRSAGPGPEQGTYTLQRRKFTATSMFLVPTDEERRRYLAVVNRAH